jgi:hypothetical protein
MIMIGYTSTFCDKSYRSSKRIFGDRLTAGTRGYEEDTR